MADKKQHMLVNRATGLVREPVTMPNRKRTGKTAKERAKRGGSSVKTDGVSK